MNAPGCFLSLEEKTLKKGGRRLAAPLSHQPDLNQRPRDRCRCDAVLKIALLQRGGYFLHAQTNTMYAKSENLQICNT